MKKWHGMAQNKVIEIEFEELVCKVLHDSMVKEFWI